MELATTIVRDCFGLFLIFVRINYRIYHLKKTEDNIDDIFVTSVIFMECSNDEVVAECYRKIEWLLNNTHFHDSSLINIMPELDFHHIQYPRYKKFIEMRRNIDGEF